MKRVLKGMACLTLVFIGVVALAQAGNVAQTSDSLNSAALHSYHRQMADIERNRIADSVKKADLEAQLKRLKTTDNLQKEELLRKLKEIADNEQQRIAAKKARIDSLRRSAKGYQVVGVMEDTLFTLYARLGSLTAQERAANISRRIQKLYDDDFLKVDSILVVKSENAYDIVYGEMVVMSVTENDALWSGENLLALTTHYHKAIKDSIVKARQENSLKKLGIRIGLVLLVIAIT